MTERNPAVARYLDQLRSNLTGLSDPEADEVVREIDNHIAEATHGGRDLAEVLSALGPASGLAQAYRVELALHPRGDGDRKLRRIFAVIGILAASSLPTLVLVPLLGGLGLGLSAGGVAAIFAGVVSPFLRTPWSTRRSPSRSRKAWRFSQGCCCCPSG